jgi:antitoxin (DNA-binding transcriptional repressor) of toxin-antitoxin stability system
VVLHFGDSHKIAIAATPRRGPEQRAQLFSPAPTAPIGRSTKWPSNSYNCLISTHSVAEAKNRLPELIDRALEGEDIVITRHGRPVVELKAIPRPAKPVTSADLDWLAARRVGQKMPDDDAGTFVSKMRDEDER